MCVCGRIAYSVIAGGLGAIRSLGRGRLGGTWGLGQRWRLENQRKPVGDWTRGNAGELSSTTVRALLMPYGCIWLRLRGEGSAEPKRGSLHVVCCTSRTQSCESPPSTPGFSASSDPATVLLVQRSTGHEARATVRWTARWSTRRVGLASIINYGVMSEKLAVMLIRVDSRPTCPAGASRITSGGQNSGRLYGVLRITRTINFQHGWLMDAFAGPREPMAVCESRG